MKLVINNPNGSQEQVEHESKEAFINERFGSAYEAFCERGGSVSALNEDGYELRKAAEEQAAIEKAAAEQAEKAAAAKAKTKK